MKFYKQSNKRPNNYILIRNDITREKRTLLFYYAVFTVNSGVFTGFVVGLPNKPGGFFFKIYLYVNSIIKPIIAPI
jgi:hypothetical protein